MYPQSMHPSSLKPRTCKFPWSGERMRKRKGIAAKFMVIVSAISTVLFVVLTLVIIQTSSKSQTHQAEGFKGVIGELLTQEKQSLSAELEKKGQSIADLLALSSVPLILGYDFDALQRLADNAMKDKSIVYVTFYGEAGSAITKVAEKTEKDLKTIQEQISFEGKVIGRVDLGLSLALIRQKDEEAASRNEQLAAQTDAALLKANRSLMAVVLVSALLGVLVLCLAIYASLRRYVVRPVGLVAAGLIQGAEEVTNASWQLESASQQLASGASEQAASLEETSASLEELLAMNRKNSENSRCGDTLMREAQLVVELSNKSMARQTESMSAISRASEETSKIIKTIDEIAFQTNLLALNAAVEAARAGESGAGFAVVAGEVRNLAMRAAAAAKDTEKLIAAIAGHVHAGSEHVQQANEQFAHMSEKITKVGSLVTEIAGATSEQDVSFDQVNKAMLEIDRVVQQTASSAEESASAATEMHAQAENLKGFVGELLDLIGAGNSGQQLDTPAATFTGQRRDDGNALFRQASRKKQERLAAPDSEGEY
ncbi:MAG: hypothetical protein HY885_00005 [Deltaproteobacteria bacterium]|nr:hypothetical protein [Deltaproteobacteria bacterium]